MNNTHGRHERLEQIAALAAELRQAQDDLNLYDRLKTAAMQVKNLSVALAAAQQKHDAATEQESTDDFEAEMSEFIDISVTGEGDDNMLRAQYRVHVTRMAYDYATRQNVPTTTTHSFDSLPFEARRYLVFKRPDAIPASIRGLAPEPDCALTEYMAACRRGYVRSFARDDARSGVSA